MADKTGIEWTDATWTPIRARNKATGKVGWHCEHASPGCINCYSETFNEKRLGTGLPFKPGHRSDVEHFLDEAMLTHPLRWRRPRMVFVCSMTDLFGDWVSDEWIDRVFAVMALAPQHTFQVLTKRAERMRDYLAADGGFGPWGRVEHRARQLASVPAGKTLAHLGGGALPNVWMGVSAEDQKRADERVPILLDTPATVHWVSAEPLLGPIDYRRISIPHPVYDGVRAELDALTGQAFDLGGSPLDRPALARLDWIVAGGESGAGARPMHPDWVRAIRDQCAAADVPFLFKQWGAWLDEQVATAMHMAPGPEMFDRFGGPKGDRWHPYEASDRNGGMMIRVGKKAAGRTLDGVTHDAFPHEEEVRFG